MDGWMMQGKGRHDRTLHDAALNSLEWHRAQAECFPASLRHPFIFGRATGLEYCHDKHAEQVEAILFGSVKESQRKGILQRQLCNGHCATSLKLSGTVTCPRWASTGIPLGEKFEYRMLRL